MLEYCKLKLGIPTSETSFDDELNVLISAALIDLGIAGVDIDSDDLDAISKQAIALYVMCNFGNPANYDRLKKAYDEQKAQLSMATGYTDWGDIDE